MEATENDEAQLYELTKRWTTYEDIPRSQQLECRKIGERLNQSGGFSLMQRVCREAHARNPAASVLAAYWDGIGEWQW